MRAAALLVLVALAACTSTSEPSSPAIPPSAQHVEAGFPPYDSLVVMKTPPATLIRGDGATCLVRPAIKWQAVEIGQPFTMCQWQGGR